MLKKYEVVGYINLTTQIKVEDKFIEIIFGGGNTYPLRRGIYTTENPKIQKALEKAKDFNKKYKLVQINNRVLSKVEAEKPIDEQIIELKKEREELHKEISSLKAQLDLRKLTKNTIGTSVPDIVNGQQAKDYLVKQFKCDADKLKNKMLIQQEMKRRNILFPDWK